MTLRKRSNKIEQSVRSSETWKPNLIDHLALTSIPHSLEASSLNTAANGLGWMSGCCSRSVDLIYIAEGWSCEVSKKWKSLINAAAFPQVRILWAVVFEIKTGTLSMSTANLINEKLKSQRISTSYPNFHRNSGRIPLSMSSWYLYGSLIDRFELSGDFQHSWFWMIQNSSNGSDRRPWSTHWAAMSFHNEIKVISWGEKIRTNSSQLPG